jgi:hypothetical protein
MRVLKLIFDGRRKGSLILSIGNFDLLGIDTMLDA